MKAAQYTAPGCVEIVQADMPFEAPDRMLIQMTHAAVCGSDLHVLHDSSAARFPLPPGRTGHECVGRVVAGPSEASVGRPVLVIPPNDDGFAEYVAVEARHAIPLPEVLTLEEGLLAQQLGTVLHCLRKIDPVIGLTAAVVGQGPAGLLFTMMLAQSGAGQVIGFDLVDHRLDVARRLGATAVSNSARENPREVVRELTGGRMADLVVEVVGKAETVNLCAELVRPKGTVLLFGVPKRPTIEFEVDRFFRKQARLVPSVGTQAEPDHWPFRLALDLVARRRVDLSPLISHRVPFERIGEAFHLAHSKEDGAVKVLLEFLS